MLRSIKICHFLFFVTPFFFHSCKKAGQGGEAEVSVLVKHHIKPIPGAFVKVKYNAKEFPGADARYDYTVACGETGHATGHCHVKELKTGDYYFYAEGYDSSIMQKVTGGLAIRISRSERKKE